MGLGTGGAATTLGNQRTSMPRAAAAVLRGVWAKLRSRTRSVVLVYLVLELINFWRFRQRLKRLRLPKWVYRRATLDDLRWLLLSVEHPICPVRLNKASMQNFLEESQGTHGKSLSWEHYYRIIQESFCIHGPSPEEHALILKIASAYTKNEGLPGPPARARPPSIPVPLAYGQSPVQVVHKPIPMELFIGSIRWLADAIFRALGYRSSWVPTSDGWIRCWVATPKDIDPGVLPAVFIHGVGMGAAPYLPFLERLRRARAARLLVIELPNCSRCSFQASMPTPATFCDALERILRTELRIGKPGRYVLLGHSLGTDFCSFVMNDPRMVHEDPPIRPARLVLLDPVCFVHEVADAHRLPFWTVREAIARSGAPWWQWPLHVALLFFVIRDEFNQEATKRCIVPGTDSIFRCSPQQLRRCPTMVCLSGNDKALPAWKVHDYIRAQMPDISMRMHPNLEHGGFLMFPLIPFWLARSHADDVLQFLGGGGKAHRKVKEKDVPRVTSLPGVTPKQEELTLAELLDKSPAKTRNDFQSYSDSENPA